MEEKRRVSDVWGWVIVVFLMLVYVWSSRPSVKVVKSSKEEPEFSFFWRSEEELVSGRNDKVVAVVDLKGVVGGSGGMMGGGEGITYENFHRFVKKVERDPRVVGVLIRLNSPGGSASVSQEIYDEILKLKAEKGVPVVVWVEDLAASGGYYIASAADEIIAVRSALVGSIGVIMMSFDMSEMLKKLGIRPVIIKSGKHKDILTGFRPVSPEEKKMMQDLLDEVYAQFINDVLKGRQGRISEKKLREVADGRVFVATKAKELGLIDEVGDFDEAVKRVRTMAKVPDARVVLYEKKVPSIFELFKNTASFFNGDRLLFLAPYLNVVAKWWM